MNNICYSRKLFVSKNSWIVVPFRSPIWFLRKIFSLWKFPKKMLQFQVRIDFVSNLTENDELWKNPGNSLNYTFDFIHSKARYSLQNYWATFFMFINRKSLFPIFIKIIEKNKRNESIGMYDSLVTSEGFSDLLLILVNGHVYPITQFNALSMIGKLFCNVHCLVGGKSLARASQVSSVFS